MKYPKLLSNTLKVTNLITNWSLPKITATILLNVPSKLTNLTFYLHVLVLILVSLPSAGTSSFLKSISSSIFYAHRESTLTFQPTIKCLVFLISTQHQWHPLDAALRFLKKRDLVLDTRASVVFTLDLPCTTTATTTAISHLQADVVKPIPSDGWKTIIFLQLPILINSSWSLVT